MYVINFLKSKNNSYFQVKNKSVFDSRLVNHLKLIIDNALVAL